MSIVENWHDILVVVNDVDAGHLGENLHQGSLPGKENLRIQISNSKVVKVWRNLQQPSPPLRYLEHDCPPRSRDNPFGVYGGFDFGEFSLDPFHVRAVIVQALQDA